MVRMLRWWGIALSLLAFIIAGIVPPDRMNSALFVEASIVAVFLAIGLQARLEGIIGMNSMHSRHRDLYWYVARLVPLMGGGTLLLILAYFLLPVGDFQTMIGTFALPSGVVLAVLIVRTEQVLEYRRELRANGTKAKLLEEAANESSLGYQIATGGIYVGFGRIVNGNLGHSSRRIG